MSESKRDILKASLKPIIELLYMQAIVFVRNDVQIRGYSPLLTNRIMSIQEFGAIDNIMENERIKHVNNKFDELCWLDYNDQVFTACPNQLALRAYEMVLEMEGITSKQFYMAWTSSWLRDLDNFLKRLDNVKENGYTCAAFDEVSYAFNEGSFVHGENDVNPFSFC